MLYTRFAYGNILQSTVKIETAGLRVVVAILLDSKTGVFSQRNVISPSGCRHPQVLATREKGRQKCRTDA